MNMNSATYNPYTLSPWFVSLYVASVIGFSYNAENFLVSNLLGVALIIVFAIESLAKRLNPFQIFTLAHYLFFWFVLLCAGSLIIAPEGYLRVRTLVQLFILSVVISNVIGQTGDLRSVKYGVLTGLGFAVLTNIGTLSSSSSAREAATLGNANIYALALLVGTIFCLYTLFELENQRFKVMTLIFHLALILMFGFQIVFLTGSRKGIIVFCTLLILTYFYVLRHQSRIFKFFSLLGFVLLIIGFWQTIQLSPHYRRLEKAILFAGGTNSGDKSISTRLDMIYDAFSLWSKKPLFGWGADQFRYISEFGTYSHNNYTELLVTVGLVGFTIFYGIYIYILTNSAKLFKSKNIGNKNLGFWIFLIGFSFLVMDIAAVSYYSKLYWIVLSTIFGLISFQKNITSADYQAEEAG